MLERVLHPEEGVCNSSGESEAFWCKEATRTCGVRESGHPPGIRHWQQRERFMLLTSRRDKKVSSARNSKRKFPAVCQ